MKNNHKYVSKGTVTNIKSPNGNDLDKVIDLLKIPTQKRTKSEIKIIQNYMINNIEYFRKMSQEPDEIERIPKIIQILNYERFQKDEPIINYGEIGDKFYIILSGNVNVYKAQSAVRDFTLSSTKHLIYFFFLGKILYYIFNSG
jgi:hypothetical protein